jgi:RND superfamily putative drug exporter
MAWVAFFAVLTPTALGYTHWINYGTSSNALAGTESARASALLAQTGPAQSTLLVVVNQSGWSPATAANRTLALQAAIVSARIPYLASTASAYSVYASSLDESLGPTGSTIRSLAGNVTGLLGRVYELPAQFLANWTTAGATRSTINATSASVGWSPSGYTGALRAWLDSNYTSERSPSELVQRAVAACAPLYFPDGPTLRAVLQEANVSAFRGTTVLLVQSLLADSGGSSVPLSWVRAATEAGDFGVNLVRAQGLAGAPTSIQSRFVSPDGTVSLVVVSFTVSEDFRTSDGGYPAQSATPTIRALVAQYLGPNSYVTGSGAVAYDTQQLESGAGILFALTFVLLAVAVAITLRSWIAPLLALVVVSLSTVVGYLAIEATGILFGKVDFVVTYTLTAVTLGVATDYLLFLSYRFREELTKGVPPAEAIETATRTSGFAILVSAITVAVGLGTLSLLSGLTSWGPVLCVTVLTIGALEVTLLPALLRLIGPRLFLKRWLKPAAPTERSVFYRAAARSSSRPLLVVAIALVVAVPAVASFFLVPTTYDFSGNLPSDLPSSRGEALLEAKFGANLLFPTYVIVTAQGNFLLPNGSASPEASTVLPHVAMDLMDRPGVTSVEGPFVAGRNLTNSSTLVPYLLENGRAAYYTVYTIWGPYSTNAIGLVESLRSDPSYLVGGLTSSLIDQQALNNVQYPLLEVLLTVFIGAILGIAFRSVTIPLISLSGVFLSISVATGLLFLIAQYLLHQPLIYLIPLILFVILLSLGNDYTVFLLSRVREEQARFGASEGIRRGIAGNGVVVSALGLILAASLGSLALQPLSFLEQIGIAFVISLVIDTFLVRPFYFPALLTLVERRRKSGGPLTSPTESSSPGKAGG